MSIRAINGLIRLSLGLFLLSGGIQVSYGELPRIPGDQMSAEQIEKGAAAVHPATLYVLAKQLFERGRKDDAVFWFYVGQLRYRFYLAVNPHLEPSGDPALFSALSEVVGRPLNEYAFRDRVKLVATLRRVEEWDERNPNGFTSKENNHGAWQATRQGFRGFIGEVEGIGGLNPGGELTR